jgi:hypothetical protein
MSRPNRIVLVDEGGRVYDRTGVSIDFWTQDGGLTLKVFVKPLDDETRHKANADHLTALSQALGLP